MAQTVIARKLVVIGDGACGKTCLLFVFAHNEFPENYVPTVFENYVANIEVDDMKVELALWDTAGQEDYAHIRPLSYQDSHVFLICFSVENRDSFENVATKWVPEMKNFCPRVPYVVVGCKTDLRSDEELALKLRDKGYSFVAPEEGVEMAERVKAFAYVECSARTRENTTAVFEAAVRASMVKSASGPPCCSLM
eukprot:m.85794 g.85794  ORF g.85794 m.85794 type:complete len:195 (+) comp15072_c0_seq3:555-1139(+)